MLWKSLHFTDPETQSRDGWPIYCMNLMLQKRNTLLPHNKHHTISMKIAWFCQCPKPQSSHTPETGTRWKHGVHTAKFCNVGLNGWAVISWKCSAFSHLGGSTSSYEPNEVTCLSSFMGPSVLISWVFCFVIKECSSTLGWLRAHWDTAPRHLWCIPLTFCRPGCYSPAVLELFCENCFFVRQTPKILGHLIFCFSLCGATL